MITALLALAMGAGMGLLGGGGSIVVVPLLTFGVGLTPKDAVAASLMIVALVAASGSISALMRGVLPLRAAATVGVSAVAGGLAGGVIGASMSDQLQLALLAVTMFGAAILMWRAPRRVASERVVSQGRLGAIGVGTGLVTGLIGVGGGFLIVPALVIAAGLTMQRAAAASLLVITLASVAALSRYADHATLPWPFIAQFASFAAIGAVAGGVVAPRLPQRILQQAFAVALVILGSYVLIRA